MRGGAVPRVFRLHDDENAMDAMRDYSPMSTLSNIDALLMKGFELPNPPSMEAVVANEINTNPSPSNNNTTSPTTEEGERKDYHDEDERRQIQHDRYSSSFDFDLPSYYDVVDSHPVVDPPPQLSWRFDEQQQQRLAEALDATAKATNGSGVGERPAESLLKTSPSEISNLSYNNGQKEASVKMVHYAEWKTKKEQRRQKKKEIVANMMLTSADEITAASSMVTSPSFTNNEDREGSITYSPRGGGAASAMIRANQSTITKEQRSPQQRQPLSLSQTTPMSFGSSTKDENFNYTPTSLSGASLSSYYNPTFTETRYRKHTEKFNSTKMKMDSDKVMSGSNKLVDSRQEDENQTFVSNATGSSKSVVVKMDLNEFKEWAKTRSVDTNSSSTIVTTTPSMMSNNIKIPSTPISKKKNEVSLSSSHRNSPTRSPRSRTTTSLSPTTTPTTTPTKKKKKKKKSKRVQFSKPLISSVSYRPKTQPEDIDELFFRDDDLLDWEEDRETTSTERFEVTMFGEDGDFIVSQCVSSEISTDGHES